MTCKCWYYFLVPPPPRFLHPCLWCCLMPILPYSILPEQPGHYPPPPPPPPPPPILYPLWCPAVFYPSTPGRYTPLLFIPGFNGAVYPSFYSVVSTNLASYGYVVASIDLYWPTDRREVGRAVWDGVNVALGQDISKTNAEKSFQLIQWVRVSAEY